MNRTLPEKLSHVDVIASLMSGGSSPGLAGRCIQELGCLQLNVRSLLSAKKERKGGAM